MSSFTRIVLNKQTQQSIIAGTGDPTGGQATTGSLYIRSDGNTSTFLYQKIGPLSTDWVAIGGSGGGGGSDFNTLINKPTLISSSAQFTGNGLFWTGANTWSVEGQFRQGAQSLRLVAGASDHVYMAWYARTANQTQRSGWLGYGSSATSDMQLTNELVGDLVFTTNGSNVARFNTTTGLTLYQNSINASDGIGMLARVGNYTKIIDPAGGTNILIGNGIDPTNYYDNTTHIFRARGAGSTLATLRASDGLTLNGARINDGLGNPMLQQSSGYIRLYDPIAGQAFQASAAANAYNNVEHDFNNRAGSQIVRLSTGTNISQMQFYRGAGGTLAGYVYADSTGFGLLHSNGTWSTRTNITDGGTHLHDNAGTEHLSVSASLGVMLMSNVLSNGNNQRIWSYAGDSYHRLYAPGVSTPAMFIGNSGDPSNYYDNTNHRFRTLGGGSNVLMLGATSAIFTVGSTITMNNSGVIATDFILA